MDEQVTTARHVRARQLAAVLFGIYVLVMLWQLFLGPYRTTFGERSANLIPFQTIIDVTLGFGSYGLHLWFINLFGNVITFIPLGFFLSAFVPRLRSLVALLVACTLISSGAEVIQYAANVGSLDIDDVLLNVFGCALGFWLYWFVKGRIVDNG